MLLRLQPCSHSQKSLAVARLDVQLIDESVYKI